MHRSEAQIAKRCKELQLHMQVEQSDDEADGEGSAGSEDELDGAVFDGPDGPDVPDEPSSEEMSTHV